MDDFFDYAARGTKTLYRRKTFVPNSVNHLFNRRDDRAPVFLCEEDKDDFVAIAARLLGAEPWNDERGRLKHPVGGGLKLFAFAVLDNHFHFVLEQAAREATTKFMHRLMTSFTKRRNLRHGMIGPVFDERFQAKPVTSSRHLKYAIAYVHANPGTPVDYRWSGHRLILDPVIARANPWMATSEATAKYNGRGAYFEWFMRALENRRRSGDDIYW
jgi:hypothetical protein